MTLLVMIGRNFSGRALGLALIVVASTSVILSQQNQYKGIVLNSRVQQDTAIRFFYEPPGNYFHVPLVFHAVEQGDSRLNTTPVDVEGRIVYVSFDEMSQLLQALGRSNLSWQESDTIETLGSFKDIPVSDNMDILVLTSKGTGKAKVRPSRICETLKPLDLSLKSQRSLWELQLFRVNYGCQIPGFKYDAYPGDQ